ncbi:uncharacterized protein LOC128231697 [Mya arenaria]|uniref:uncharacterized protein LOC128231697 n=1 Tax=Mya arenaria TaxID=6604 RepID=UPI0022E18DF5|nr:uncharacterized protein LOC128231697 [Mya arenaria]
MNSADAKQIKAVHQEVLEVNSTTKFVLKRVNELSNALQNNPCSPACAKIQEELFEEIRNLSEENEKRRIQDEEKRKQDLETQDNINKLTQRVDELTALLNQTTNNGLQVVATKQTHRPRTRHTGKELVLKSYQNVEHTREPSTARSHHSVVSRPQQTRLGSHEHDRRLAVQSRQNIPRLTYGEFGETVESQMDLTGRHLEATSQEEKVYFGTKEVWIVEATNEFRNGRSEIGSTQGAFTVILLDTSASMRQNNAWQEASTFIQEYIEGLQIMSTEHGCEEYVALVTFGEHTQCRQRYTKSYHEILQIFDSISPGGPSPFYGGLVTAQGAMLAATEPILLLTNGITVHTKLILITDGYPTDTCLYRGPDSTNTEMDPEITQDILRMAKLVVNDDLTQADLFYLPVGRANMEFLKLVSDVGFGKELHFRDGSSFSRRLVLAGKILPGQPVNPLLGLLGLDPSAVHMSRIPKDDRAITRLDEEQMLNILEREERRRVAKENEVNPYHEEPDDSFPRTGSRVTRGPDWDRVTNEDGNEPGTVVGHRKTYFGNSVFVTWDATGKLGQYNFGLHNLYGVLPTEEPRKLNPGQPLDVGCFVTPAKDWSGDASIMGEKGVVLQILRQNGIRKVAVRWNNGSRGLYSYGEDRRFEIKMCEACELQRLEERPRPSRHLPITDGRQTGAAPSPAAIKPKKNKNKNN